MRLLALFWLTITLTACSSSSDSTPPGPVAITSMEIITGQGRVDGVATITPYIVDGLFQIDYATTGADHWIALVVSDNPSTRREDNVNDVNIGLAKHCFNESTCLYSTPKSFQCYMTTDNKMGCLDEFESEGSIENILDAIPKTLYLKLSACSSEPDHCTSRTVVPINIM